MKMKLNLKEKIKTSITKIKQLFCPHKETYDVNEFAPDGTPCIVKYCEQCGDCLRMLFLAEQMESEKNVEGNNGDNTNDKKDN